MDGIQPDCVTGACPVPPLLPINQRVVWLRDQLSALYPLVDAATIFSLAGGIDQDELELLAVIERFVKQSAPRKADG